MSLLSENILKELITDDFAGLSRINQIEGFLRSLYDAGHTKVTPQEITQLFKDANMNSPERSKKIRCGVFKVREYLDSMTTKKVIQDSVLCVGLIEDDLYELTIT
jgi:hypothetical protein